MITTKSSTFFADIHSFCNEKGMDYIDAVVHWCEINEFEIEHAAEFIKKNRVMISKLQEEAENLNFIKKTTKLPV